jgi:hypothetical protein
MRGYNIPLSEGMKRQAPFVPVLMRATGQKGGELAKGKKHATEQIVNLMRQIGPTIWRATTGFGTGEIF